MKAWFNPPSRAIPSNKNILNFQVIIVMPMLYAIFFFTSHRHHIFLKPDLTAGVFIDETSQNMELHYLQSSSVAKVYCSLSWSIFITWFIFILSCYHDLWPLLVIFTFRICSMTLMIMWHQTWFWPKESLKNLIQDVMEMSQLPSLSPWR